MQAGGQLCAQICVGCCVCLCQQISIEQNRTRSPQRKAPLYFPVASGSVVNTKGCSLAMFLLMLLCLAIFAVIFDFVQDDYYANMNQYSFFSCSGCGSYSIEFMNGQCCTSSTGTQCQDFDYCRNLILQRNEAFMIAGFVYIGLFAIGGIVLLLRYRLEKKKAAFQKEQEISLKEDSIRKGQEENSEPADPLVKQALLKDRRLSCVLCSERIRGSNSKLMVCCGAVLHISCSSLWIEHKKACPVCSKDVRC